MAVLQAEGLVANARLLGDEGLIIAPRPARPEREALAKNQARPEHGEIVLVLCMKQRVAPMVVTVVLVGSPRIVRLGSVVGASVVARGFPSLGRIGREDRAAMRQVQIDMRFETNGEAHVRAR